MIYIHEEGTAIPITQRPLATGHEHRMMPAGTRYGDIVTRPSVNIPLVVVPGGLDDGTGECSYRTRAGEYKVIGDVYSDISPLLPLLERRGRSFNFEAYGIKRVKITAVQTA